MAELRSAEALKLLALRSQNIHILADDLAADWFEQDPHQWGDPAETESDHRVHLGLVFAQRSALRRNNEVAVGTEIVVDPADIRHQEPVGMTKSPSIRKEQPRHQALRDRLSAKLYIHRVAGRAYGRRQFARVMIPE